MYNHLAIAFRHLPAKLRIYSLVAKENLDINLSRTREILGHLSSLSSFYHHIQFYSEMHPPHSTQTHQIKAVFLSSVSHRRWLAEYHLVWALNIPFRISWQTSLQAPPKLLSKILPDFCPEELPEYLCLLGSQSHFSQSVEMLLLGLMFSP